MKRSEVKAEWASFGGETRSLRVPRQTVLATGSMLLYALLASTAIAGTLGDFAISELPARPTLVVRFAVEPAQISPTLAEVLPAVFSHALEQGRVPGLVFSRTLHASEDRMFLEAGLEVDAAVEEHGTSPRGAIVPGELPAQRTATVDFYGPYHELGDAHQRLAAWWSAQDLAAVGPPVEYYVTDPTTEPDPQQWLTRVHHPVAQRSDLAPTLGFVVGRWISRGDDPFYEETWTPFVDEESLGTFRMRQAGTPVFYEFQAIDLAESAVDAGVAAAGDWRRGTLRIKHFDPRLIGWEEKDDAKRFVLSTLMPDLAIFASREGDRLAELVYRRQGETLSIVLRKWGAGQPSRSEFSFVRSAP